MFWHRTECKVHTTPYSIFWHRTECEVCTYTALAEKEFKVYAYTALAENGVQSVHLHCTGAPGWGR